MDGDLISIIIPVYNDTTHLGEVLSALEKQTFSNLEIIIVDDGSQTAVGERQSSLPILWLRQEHKGAPAARNFGFAHSKGNYVLFLDADVICSPEMLEKLHEGLQKNLEARYSYCDHYRGVKRIPARSFDAHALRRNNYITTMSLIRREDFIGFDESLKRFQDWDLWLSLLAQNKVGVYVPGFLWRSYTSRSGISTWMPSFAYRFPFRYVPFFSKQVKAYEEAKRIVQEKHHLACI